MSEADEPSPYDMPWQAAADRIAGWLRPKSDLGVVYRNRLLEVMEPLFYGFIAVWCLFVGLSILLGGESPWWLLGVGAAAAMAVGLRLVFGRPHVVVADSFVVLRGVFVTRRIPYLQIRRAEAKWGALRLVLTTGEEPWVPGFTWRGFPLYSSDGLAAEIMAHVKRAKAAAAAESPGAAGSTPAQ